jgi:hypothetical protein
MSTLTAERLLEEGAWAGKLYSGGWKKGDGGTTAVLDKATGETLTEVAVAAPRGGAGGVGSGRRRSGRRDRRGGAAGMA